MFSKFAIILFALQMLGAHSWSVNLYSAAFFQGTQLSLTGSNDDCVNVPNNYKPLSISTQGFCLRVFSDVKCRGESFAVFPASFNHGALDRYSIGIKSIRSCKSAY